MTRRAAGEAVSDESLIAAHPELMPELGEELRKLRLIAGARERADQLRRGESDTRSHRDADTSSSGRLEVRCPSCHTPMEVAVDTALTDLTCSACGSHFSLVDQSKATRMAPPLSTLGRFELVERIGVGGFGTVWKARDKELDRTVAIKIPRQGAMTAEEQEKFFREARAAAQLRHPNIVSVHEVGRDGDSVYIVSDFVRGVTLGDWLTGQQLTSREAAELCAKIADALHHAHEHGVIHRDLKPANIMIDANGQPYLMDFGLARREEGEVTVTVDGLVLGTPAYMSPEQAQGAAHNATRRSDIYSLGVILFQLLTGELPFRGNAKMLIHQVIHEEPPSPRKLNSTIPKDLETITMKCLEKLGTRRYSSAADLALELRRWLGGRPIIARPIGRLAHVLRWVKRNPALSMLTSAILVLSIVVAVGSFVAAYWLNELRKSELKAKQELQLALVESQDAKNRELLANVDLLFPEMVFSNDAIAFLEDQVDHAEAVCELNKNLIDEADPHVTMADLWLARLRLNTAKARLAWARHDWHQCERHYEVALRAAVKHVELVGALYRLEMIVDPAAERIAEAQEKLNIARLAHIRVKAIIRNKTSTPNEASD
jgi:tRNA A-37 threonylcarbamoyl transferase component Bud32